MKDRYLIGEVEELLGVPRSTIRFYVKKGLVSVEKDEENGYYYYSMKNIRQLSHLLVGRNRLHLNLKDSQHRTTVSTLAEYHEIIYRREKELLDSIAEARRSLDVLDIYEQMFYRIKRGLGKISVLPESTYYFFPQKYVFNSKTSVIDIGFPTAVFLKEKQVPVFDGFLSMVYKRDVHLLEDEDLSRVQYVLKDVRFVSTVVKTDRDYDDPHILSSALNWAKRNNVGLKPPFYVNYLTELLMEGEKCFFYEVLLPIK